MVKANDINISFNEEDLKFMTALQGFDYIINDSKPIKFSEEAENSYGGHVRVSTDEQAEEGKSIQRQTELIDEKVIKLKGKLVETFIEDGLSASKNKLSKRPKMMALINGFLEGRYRNIISYEEDRLFRNPNEQLAIIAFIVRKGGRIYFTNNNSADILHEQYGLDAGWEQIGTIIKAIQNKQESLKTSKRVLDTMESVAKNGEFTGTVTPIGYKRIGEKFEIADEEAVFVKEMEDLYLQGNGLHTIIKYMNGEHTNALGKREGGKVIRPKRRKNDSEYWTDEVMQTILFSWWYAGEIPFNEKHYPSKIHKGIRSKEKHEEILLKRKNKSTKGKKPNPRKNSTPFLLSDILFCGECHKEYKGRTTPNQTKKNYRWYRCNNQERQDKREVCSNKKRYPKEILEEFVLQKIKQYLVNYNFDNVYNIIVEKTSEKDKKIEIEIENKKKELEKKEKYKNNLRQTIVNHENDLELKELDEEGHAEMLKDYKQDQINLLKEIKQLKNEKELLKNTLNNQTNESLDISYVHKKMIEFVNKFDKINMGQKKLLMEEFIDKIEVFSNGEVAIHYKLYNKEMEETVNQMAVSKEVVSFTGVGDTTTGNNTTGKNGLETLINKGFSISQTENILDWCNEIYFESRSKFKEFLIGSTLKYTENGRINAWQLHQKTGISHYTARAYFNYSHFPTEEKMIQVLKPFKKSPMDFIKYTNIDNLNEEMFFKIINTVNRWYRDEKIGEEKILEEVQKRVAKYKEDNTLNRAIIYSVQE